MNAKTLVCLLVLFALAIAALLLVRPDVVPPQSQHASDPHDQADTPNGDKPVLYPSDLGKDLTGISFDGGLMGTLLQIEKIRGRWWVTAPSRFPANRKAVDELLRQLGAMTGRPTEQSGGLVPDSSGVFLSYTNTKIQLWFSSRLGAGRAIITVNENDVSQNYNATDTLHDIFDSLNPDAFYHNRFAPPLMPEIGWLEIATPEGKSTLVQDDGLWWIEGPEGRERALEQGLSGHSGLDNYFELFNAAELIEKQTHASTSGMASFGLEKPLISARFVPIGQDPSAPSSGYEVHVGTPADPQDQTRYISNGHSGKATDPVFTVSTPIALAFGQDAKAFRDPRVTAMPVTLIKSITYWSPGSLSKLKIHLAADGSASLIATPQNQIDAATTQPLASAKTQAMLKALAAARAQGYVKEPEEGAIIIQRCELHARLSEEAETIWIYHDAESTQDQPSVLIRRGEESVLLRVVKADVDALLNPNMLLIDK